MFTKEDRSALLLVGATSGANVDKKREIIDLFDNLSDIFTKFSLYRDSIIEIADEKFFRNLEFAVQNDTVAKLEEKLDEIGAGFVTFVDDEYPELLRQIDRAPLVLFYKGDLSLLKSDCIAVVGSRDCSRLASTLAKDFSYALAKSGITVVSGLAKGIDACAHEGALSVANGKTVAVLGCGIDVIYPAENKELFAEIEKRGLIISEYLPGENPEYFHFPERNRLMSGLSDGVLVVEAREKSGSLITANVAIDQGRDVFVIPYNVNSRCATGSNEFLKAYPQTLVTEPNDILRFYGMDEIPNEKSEMFLDVMEEKIVEALEKGELHFDELLEITKLNANNLNSLLAKMEISGIINRLGGNVYSL